MKKKLRIIFSLLILIFIMTGCLVQDDSQTMMNTEEKEEIKEKARDITDDFFKYNTYDSENDSNYSAQGLLDLFKQDLTGEVLTIDPILGGRYGKNFGTLKEELNNKEALFEAFEAQLSDDKFLYNDYKLTFDYEIFFVDDDIQDYTARYNVKFQVFEVINGEKIPTPDEVPEGITDNGVITFELVNELDGWMIENMMIDFRKVGEISIN